MPSLKAWEQGSGAPAHRQVVQGPLPQCVREGLEPSIADLVRVQAQKGQLFQGPTGTGRSEGGEAHIANLITAQADVGAISQRPALNCLMRIAPPRPRWGSGASPPPAGGGDGY